MKIDRSAIVATDASFCPKSRASGYAFLIQRPGRKPYRRSGELDIKPTTNQQAEQWAIEQGILAAQQMGLRDLTVFSDCKSVINTLKKNPRRGIRYYHIRAHTNKINLPASMNRWCDNEARRVMRGVRKQLSLNVQSGR